MQEQFSVNYMVVMSAVVRVRVSADCKKAMDAVVQGHVFANYKEIMNVESALA